MVIGALRLRQIRKVLRDRIGRATSSLRSTAMPDERRDDALGNGLDVGRARLATAVEVALEDDAAALRHEQTVQSRKLARRLDRRIEKVRGVRGVRRVREVRGVRRVREVRSARRVRRVRRVRGVSSGSWGVLASSATPTCQRQRRSARGSRRLGDIEG